MLENEDINKNIDDEYVFQIISFIIKLMHFIVCDFMSCFVWIKKIIINNTLTDYFKFFTQIVMCISLSGSSIEVDRNMSGEEKN